MSITFGRAGLLGLAALAWSAAPLMTAELGWPGLGDTAAHAKNNKSNNGHHGGGNSDHGNSGQGTSGVHANNANAGHGHSAAPPGDGDVALADGQPEGWVPPGQAKEKNIHALAGGLNSLGRNINGFLNGGDEKLDGFRDYVVANANLELAQQALDGAQMAYDDYVGGLLTDAGFDPAGFGDLSPEALQAAIDAIGDPTDPTSMDLQGVLDAVLASQELADLGQAATDADAAAVGTDDDALIAALIAGANPSRDYTEEDLNRLVPWAKEILGVGDFDGTIDDLLALWEDDTAEVEVEDGDDGDDGGGGDLPVLL